MVWHLDSFFNSNHIFSEIFYLMSRGLNYKQSKELLIKGFMLDVVEKITDSEIKNFIKNIIGLKK